MQIKRGVTGVVYFIEKGKPIFLLLHRVLNWQGWEFPKGGVEAGETPSQAVFREISEEAGLLDVSMKAVLASGIEWMKKDTKYVYDGFLVESKTKKVILQKEVAEHDEFKWVDEKTALELLTHSENKMLLQKAAEFLAKGEYKRLHLVVKGKVQEVYFRGFISESVQKISGLTGFVKNLENGDVEIVAEGKEKNLSELIAVAKKGTPRSIITEVVEEWAAATGEFDDFKIIN